jgi:hypothetical protein
MSLQNAMKPFDIRSVFAIAALTLLSACGGTAPDAAPPPPAAAAMEVNANLPRADCEAEGCNQPRIIDGLAEQFRASAIDQQARAAEPQAAAQDVVNLVPAAPALPTLPQERAPH